MLRVRSTLAARPERFEEHRERHAAVWPEVLRVQRDAGWHDHQLFLRAGEHTTTIGETP